MSTVDRKEIKFMGYTLVNETVSDSAGATKKTYIELDKDAPVAVQVTRGIWSILVGGAVSAVLIRSMFNIKRE